MKATRTKMERQSPGHLPGKPVTAKQRDHWPVVLEYADEGPGPWIVDLSHCSRWDIQGRDLREAVPSGISLPGSPGRVTVQRKGLVGRTGLKQAFLWLFDDKAGAPAGIGCTDTTEASLCIALLGKDVFKIAEKLTPLDVGNPKRKAPFLLLGPFSHVTSQLVVLNHDPVDAVLLIACSRGFAHDMVHAVLAAGEEWGLRPAGELKFQEMLKSVAA